VRARAMTTTGGGQLKKAARQSGSQRIPQGFSAKLSSARRLIRRRILVERLHFLAVRSDWEIANRVFGSIAAQMANSAAAIEILSSATLRGARDAELRRRFKTASRFWVWHAVASGDVEKASRNLARCARLFTKNRMDHASISGALQAWRLLAAMDSQSGEAKHGQAWCHASLARIAEEASDLATAQAEWSAALRLLPTDQTALEGLRRVLEPNFIGQSPADRAASARALYERLVRDTQPDYGSQCAAASLLLDAAASDLALGFIEAALKRAKRPEATLLLFRCYAGLARYEDAGAALIDLAEMGNRVPVIPAPELRAVLAHVPPEMFSAATLAKLAAAENAQRIAPVLLPYAIERGFPEVILALSNNIRPNEDWSPATAFAAADILWPIAEQLPALRILAPFSNAEPIASRFASYAQACDIDEVEHAVLPPSPQQPGFAEGCLLMAEIHRGRGNLIRAANVLCRISEAGESAQSFYQLHKGQIASLVEASLRAAAPDIQIRRDLASLVASWGSGVARVFYSSDEFLALYEGLVGAARLASAPPASRLGFFRELYFEHHLERREERDPEIFDSEFSFCEAVLQYFRKVGTMRPVEAIPVAKALKARLGKRTLSFDPGRSADVSMSYAILKGHPSCDLASKELFETLASWYIQEFMPANNIPSACLPPDVTAHFNTAIDKHPGVGAVATRFAHLMRDKSEAYRSRYDLENSVDALLFSLELVAVLLRVSPQYRPFIAAMIPADGDEQTFADLCIGSLARPGSEPLKALTVSSALDYRVRHFSTRTWPPRGTFPQDVLLIGHGTEGTGLGRNFQMLTEALSGGDISLTSLAYEAEADVFAEELREWYGRCRTRPVVIAAVNAHDIPALFIKDRYDVLDDCRIVGFFLWETSQAPRVQHLGIRLVDEIWTPTNYVASIYAPFAPVHVVGKGLFSAAECAAVPDRAALNPIRFLTIFDFHSSVERKNPLAVVLAFQKAFAAGERVELVLKASNVNPQHTGNVSGQWERLCAASASDGRIRIVADRYTERQMQQLMRDTSCVVSLHRSEGFGYVLSDAMALGIPVIATDYSGNVDFCDPETSYPVSYRTIPAVSHAHWESGGAQWAEPDIDSASKQMLAVYSDYPEALRKAAFGRERILEKYSTEAFAARLRQRLAALYDQPDVDPHLQAAQ
jgi:glycosyltransferase involved in cell wall biosynthesis